MKKQFKKWATFTLRWGIAVAGIWFVLSKMSFHDRVTILDGDNRPVAVRIVDGESDSSPVFKQADGPALISRDQVWTLPDRPSVLIHGPDRKAEKA